MPFNKETAKRYGSLGGLTSIARHGAFKRCAAMRARRWQRLLATVNPDGTLTAEDAATRAKALQRVDAIRAANARWGRTPSKRAHPAIARPAKENR